MPRKNTSLGPAPAEESRVAGGIPFLRPVRQPDGYTCGPACIRMALDHLGFRPDLSVRSIGEEMGTNPRTGTTHVEMARGLVNRGLAHARPATAGFADDPEAALAHLRSELEARRIVFLRTLVGGWKHWVLVHAVQADGDFRVACPSRGSLRWTPGHLLECWSARGFDHFAVPGERRHHPGALAMEASREGRRAVHEMTLREFLGGVPVIPDHRLQRRHHEAIARCASLVPAMGSDPAAEEMAYDAMPGFAFLALPSASGWRACDMAAVERETGAVAGGILGGVRWVHPDFRGRGLGAELVLAAYSDPGRTFLMPSSYSEAGHASRVAAHRIAVERALAAGLEVPDRVLAEEPLPLPASPDREGSRTSGGDADAPPLQLRLF